MADDRAYRILLSFEPESSAFRARVPELELEVEADTREEALQKAESAMEERIDAAAQSGEELPHPADAAEVPSGEVTLTLAPLVMKDLAYFAARSDMTPDELAAQLIARGVAQMLAPHEERRRPPRREDAQPSDDRPDGNRGRRRDKREGYRPDLDDKSNWLAYLREQEKGGGGRGRR